MNGTVGMESGLKLIRPSRGAIFVPLASATLLRERSSRFQPESRWPFPLLFSPRHHYIIHRIRYRWTRSTVVFISPAAETPATKKGSVARRGNDKWGSDSRRHKLKQQTKTLLIVTSRQERERERGYGTARAIIANIIRPDPFRFHVNHAAALTYRPREKGIATISKFSDDCDYLLL